MEKVNIGVRISANAFLMLAWIAFFCTFGGNIVVGKRSQEEVIALFKGFGFDRVYHQLSDITVAIAQLKEDLKHGQAKREGEARGN
jgi:methylmalonyl-CoA mutase cobalamin-binding subunit